MNKKYLEKYNKATVDMENPTEIIGRLLAIIDNILSEEGLAQIVPEDEPDFCKISYSYRTKHIRDYSRE